MPTRRENREKTRAAIIIAAIELMSEHGYRSTTTTDIAERAGVSPATLFNYFPNKAAILFGDSHLWVPPTHVEPGATPRETLLRLFEGMVRDSPWVRGVDDPLTKQRFELVRGEPELTRMQSALGLEQVAEYARAVRAHHPEVNEEESVALAGALIGAVMATVNAVSTQNLREAIGTAAHLVLGLPRGHA